MPIYKNLGGDSGVYSYEIYEDKIVVTFSTGSCYEYNYRKTGIENIKKMKFLAMRGQGLNSFINTHVKYKYSRRIR